MYLPKKAALGLALVGVLGGFAAAQATTHLANPSQTIVAKAATTVNAKTQGMVPNGTTDNAPKLQSIIDAYSADDNVTIRVPKGTYLFTNATLKAIKLHSNITFDFDDGAVFKISKGDRIPFVYPSPSTGYDGGISNVTWKNATFSGDYTTSTGQAVFVQSLNHASNVTFEGCTFDNCESPTGTTLILMVVIILTSKIRRLPGLMPTPITIIKKPFKLIIQTRRRCLTITLATSTMIYHRMMSRLTTISLCR
ncbi:glycosyl hydrolase family 28-related protein [Secundilactobacillus kimchicus]|uniref:glycosyl hydrolase family 28-related protein n=1 Tax=Secundilactobacillus kimchicus TaxID=528209 RepID=UPI0006D07415|nr:glycosyl hydrolase family 28-related protein [Secundilactobacillus kimchicus]